MSVYPEPIKPKSDQKCERSNNVKSNINVFGKINITILKL